MTEGGPKRERLRSKYGLNIDQLDYKYLKDCDNAKIIERILIVLRSGEEGVYPDLVRFTEDRLRAVKPSSSLLRIDQPAQSLRSLNPEERKKLLGELEEWKTEVSAADAELKTAPIEVKIGKENQLPPVRGTVQVTTKSALKPEAGEKPAPRISSFDYAAWDRYDVNAELQKLDGSSQPEKQSNPLRVEGSDAAIEDQPDTSGLSDAEKTTLALREKEKGNEYFRDGDFTRAAIYYTRSIHVHPTVAAYNNRAQANLKLGKHGSALMDCSYVLRREPQNVKALLRRGIARQMAKNWLKAREDFQQVLQLESSNPQAKQRLAEVERSIISSEDKTRKKMLIQEVDSLEHEESINSEKGAGDAQKLARKSEANQSPKPTPGGQNMNTKVDLKAADLFRRENDEENVILNAEPMQTPNKILIEEIRKSAPGSTKPSEIAPTNVDAHSVSTTELSGGIVPEVAEQDHAKESIVEADHLLKTEQTEKPAPEIQNPAPTPSQKSYVQVSTEQPQTGKVSKPQNAAATSEPEQCEWTSFRFLRRWRQLRSCGTLAPYVCLLRSVPPQQLPALFGAELDAGVLSIVIRCVLEVMLTEDGPQRCRQLLEAVSAAERFHVAKLLLDKRDQQRLAKLAASLKRMGADVTLLSRRFNAGVE